MGAYECGGRGRGRAPTSVAPGNVQFPAVGRAVVPKQLLDERIHDSNLQVVRTVAVHAVTQSHLRERGIELR